MSYILDLQAFEQRGAVQNSSVPTLSTWSVIGCLSNTSWVAC
jgi:hypothetical protein